VYGNGTGAWVVPAGPAALPAGTQICSGQTEGLTDFPIQRIAEQIQPDKSQQPLLDNLKAVTAEALGILRAACPGDLPSTPTARLAAMRSRVEAMLQAARVIDPGAAEILRLAHRRAEGTLQLPRCRNPRNRREPADRPGTALQRRGASHQCATKRADRPGAAVERCPREELQCAESGFCQGERYFEDELSDRTDSDANGATRPNETTARSDDAGVGHSAVRAGEFLWRARRRTEGAVQSIRRATTLSLARKRRMSGEYRLTGQG
jgi:hypothetical protein